MAERTPEQAEAEARLEAAILDCAATYEGPGEFLTCWSLVAGLTSDALSEDGSTAYLRLRPANQPFHVTLGLLAYERHMLAAGDDE